MGRYVTITRWTPQTARALDERWNTVTIGTAPKIVLDAFAKANVIAFEVSGTNCFSLMISEMEDFINVEIVARYLTDLCTMETYPVTSFENWLPMIEKFPMTDVPKPEKWTK